MPRFKVRFLCSEMTKPELRVNQPLQVFIIDWLLIIVNQTQVGATYGTFCCNASHIIKYVFPWKLPIYLQSA